jgi:membrane-associated phospholipid phosphatase
MQWLGGLGGSSLLPRDVDARLLAQPAAAGRAGQPPTARARSAARLRIDAANVASTRVAAASTTNSDERRYSTLVASYSKGLPHLATGEVEPAAFAALVKAAESGRPTDFEAVPSPGDIRQVNPLAAFAFTLAGPDPHALPLPAPPRFDSAEIAAEACELYWQALTRDVPFEAFASDATVAAACQELTTLPAFRGPRVDGAVTPATVFRGSFAGDLVGPYVSQFLWKEVPYGAIRLVPHVRTATPGLDYLTRWDDWLAVQNGAGTASRHAGTYRYIRSARDLAAYVQLDFTYQAFLTACLVLFGMEGTTDVRRPYKGAPFDATIPYRTSKTQSGFSTLGVAHALDLVARVANLALQHSWYHKWVVHRWLRPEEYGGRLHRAKADKVSYPLHASVLDSVAVARTFDRTKSYLLPQAYPEGCPLHPSYPSGHATIAGACATVLKAFFDEAFPIEEPVVAAANGLSLLPYRGAALTVGGELNKLASNVSMGRSAAGIHWRSDNVAGLALGEAVALALLAELKACLPEPFDGFSVTRFDGVRVTV